MKLSKTKLPDNIWFIPTIKDWPCNNDDYIVYRLPKGVTSWGNKNIRFCSTTTCQYYMKFKMV